MSQFAVRRTNFRGGARTIGLRRVLRFRSSQIGIVLCLTLIVVALLGPFVAPYSPTSIQGLPFEGPSWEHPLGLDVFGRDGFSRFLHGGRSVIGLSLFAALIGSLVGTIVGLIAGYKRGWMDSGLMRFSDAIISFPALILALVLVSTMGPRLWLVVLAVALTHAPRVARIVRAVTLEASPEDYVQAAEARGEGTTWILRREILPNLWTPILVDFGLRVAASVIIIASLSFLGFGLQPPASDWGLMINENRQALTSQPYVSLLPVIAIGLLAIGANLITDGISRAAGRHSVRDESLR